MLAAADSPTRTAPPVSPRDGQPSPVIAAIAFLEGVSRSGTREALSAWLIRDVFLWGWAEPSDLVAETGHATFDLGGVTDSRPLRALLLDARARASDGIRSLRTAAEGDALALTLVERGSLRRDASTGRWEPRVAAGKPLSEMVLSLVAADMLARPAAYRELLSVCARCDRVSFQPALTGRDGCLMHQSTRRPR